MEWPKVNGRLPDNKLLFNNKNWIFDNWLRLQGIVLVNWLYATCINCRYDSDSPNVDGIGPASRLDEISSTTNLDCF